MKYLAMLSLLLLSACGIEKDVTTSVHIRKATELCAQNGGVATVEHATISREYESCGSKCNRETGRLRYRGKASCANGATFQLEFSE